MDASYKYNFKNSFMKEIFSQLDGLEQCGTWFKTQAGWYITTSIYQFDPVWYRTIHGYIHVLFYSAVSSSTDRYTVRYLGTLLVQ